MDDKELLDSLFYRLKDIKDREGLLHIRERQIDNKHPFTHFSDVTGARVSLQEPPQFLWWDFFYISNDLVHFTSFLFLLRPHINDPRVEDGTYHQSWYDARFLSYAGILHSSIYNFWDRIGDLLFCFFETGLDPGRVYIGRVLENFPSEHRESPHFQNLRDAYNNKVHPVIIDRHDHIHNQSIATTHYYAIILSRGHNQEQSAEQKLRLPELFKEQIALANEGFELALRLIEEKGERVQT